MPIYEYRCTDCNKHVEKMQKVSDAPLTKCESCGGKLEKMISLSGFQFKGAGWYITDYSGKSSPSSEAPSESKTSSTDTSSGGSTE
jgi:putative FmdB family regulatory protein